MKKKQKRSGIKIQKVIWAVVHDFDRGPNDHRYYPTRLEASKQVRRLIAMGWESLGIFKYVLGED